MVQRAKCKQWNKLQVRWKRFLTQGMQSIVNTSSSCNELSAQSALDAESGNKLMKQMIQQMNIIQNSVHSGVKQVETMKEQSEEIVKIIDVMQAIASQINLLALNAAIEARPCWGKW